LGHEFLSQETLAEDINLEVDPDEITIDSDKDAPTSATLYRYLVKKKSA
jgi:tRNA 2-thiouridine synthesizing protein A